MVLLGLCREKSHSPVLNEASTFFFSFFFFSFGFIGIHHGRAKPRISILLFGQMKSLFLKVVKLVDWKQTNKQKKKERGGGGERMSNTSINW